MGKVFLMPIGWVSHRECLGVGPSGERREKSVFLPWIESRSSSRSLSLYWVSYPDCKRWDIWNIYGSRTETPWTKCSPQHLPVGVTIWPIYWYIWYLTSPISTLFHKRLITISLSQTTGKSTCFRYRSVIINLNWRFRLWFWILNNLLNTQE
jgi:hypothetical protein